MSYRGSSAFRTFPDEATARITIMAHFQGSVDLSLASGVYLKSFTSPGATHKELFFILD